MLQKLRCGQMVSWGALEIICKLLECQPGEIIEFFYDSENKLENANTEA